VVYRVDPFGSGQGLALVNTVMKLRVLQPRS
jgi:hypothetical protein